MHSQAERICLAVATTPVEILRRIIGWQYRVRGDYTYICPNTGRTLSVLDMMLYDSFTYAPNLRRADLGPSRAAQVHDIGWRQGKWDYPHPTYGDVLTFDENNLAFRRILVAENHPRCIVELYCGGVSLPVMRRKWEQKFDHE